MPCSAGPLALAGQGRDESAGQHHAERGSDKERAERDLRLAGGPAGGQGARISAKHTLALVNPGGATTAGLLALAREVADGVRKVFGVDLAPEPVLVGADL